MLMRIAYVFFRNRRAGDIGVALQIRAAFLVKRRFLCTGQTDMNRYLCLFTGCEHMTFRRRTGFPVKQQFRVAGSDFTVAVHIRNGEINVLFFDLAGQVVENCLCVIVIGITVHIDVMTFHNRFRTIPNIGHAALRKVGRQMRQRVAYHRLREQIGAEFKGERLVRDVIDGELVIVFTVPCRIVTQLDLDLAVDVRFRFAGQIRVVYHDDGLLLNRVADLNKTRALLQNRQILAVSNHRRCGAHQQALRDRAEVVSAHQIGICRLILFEILHQDCRKAGDVRCRHGSAGIGNIGSRSALASAGRFRCAVDGVNIAARRGDLGLHHKRTRNAPGAEIGHVGILAINLRFRNDRAADLNGAGIVGDAVSCVAFALALDIIGILQ